MMSHTWTAVYMATAKARIPRNSIPGILAHPGAYTGDIYLGTRMKLG